MSSLVNDIKKEMLVLCIVWGWRVAVDCLPVFKPDLVFNIKWTLWLGHSVQVPMSTVIYKKIYNSKNAL
jgi:hypothetical protein